MEKPITVVLPTRNRYESLLVCLESLRNQSYRDFRILVSDNGSRDETSRFDSSAFPDLDIRIVHRNPSLPGLAEHYQILFSEVDTPWMALAHDDEIYHPEWLETLFSQCGPETVLSLGQILVRDLRKGGDPSFHQSSAHLLSGRYSADALKVMALRERKFFSGQAFLLRVDTIWDHLEMMSRYEQYDYALLMGCCSVGETVVSERLLATYTLHRRNTLGSEEYVAEYSQRIHACSMMEEWLNVVTAEMSGTDVVRLREGLKRNQLEAEMMTLFKNFLSLSPSTWKTLSGRIRGNPYCGTKLPVMIWGLGLLRRLLPRVPSRMIFQYLLKIRGIRPLPNKLENGDLQEKFPSALEEVSWSCLVK